MSCDEFRCDIPWRCSHPAPVVPYDFAPAWTAGCIAGFRARPLWRRLNFLWQRAYAMFPQDWRNAVVPHSSKVFSMREKNISTRISNLEIGTRRHISSIWEKRRMRWLAQLPQVKKRHVDYQRVTLKAGTTSLSHLAINHGTGRQCRPVYSHIGINGSLIQPSAADGRRGW